MTHWIDVAGEHQLETGVVHELRYEDCSIAVIKLADGIHDIEDVCTHDYESLGGGLIEGDEIICPRHGARFCIRTGEVTAPPAYEDLRTFPTRVHEGRVQICVDALDD